jgi:hypothetical protein
MAAVAVALSVLFSGGQASAGLEKSKLVKEDGAIYLEEFLDQPIKVKITQVAAVYSNLTAERWLGNLIAGREAELLAVSEKAYRVRGRAQQGQVAGWIAKSAVEGVDKKMEENLVKLHQRQVLVDDLIAKHQVALGMTLAEVEASLGKPDARRAKVDKDGHQAVFDYITYERVPQTTVSYDQFGRAFQSVTYIKVPTGKVSLSFKNELVASIEESEGSELAAQGGGAGIRIVPPPILIR